MFLNQVLDQLHNEIIKSDGNEEYKMSPISDMFGLQSFAEFKCNQCGIEEIFNNPNFVVTYIEIDPKNFLHNLRFSIIEQSIN